MKHTFIYKEATWYAEGIFYDDKDNKSELKSEIVITHNKDKWINNGYMYVGENKDFKIENKYEIEIPKGNETFLKWKSFNPGIGILIGRMDIVGDVIISNYTDEKSTFSRHGGRGRCQSRFDRENRRRNRLQDLRERPVPVYP